MENASIIVMEKAWHGRTLATLSATGSRKAQAGFEPLMGGFVRVPYNDFAAVEFVIEIIDRRYVALRRVIGDPIALLVLRQLSACRPWHPPAPMAARITVSG